MLILFFIYFNKVMEINSINNWVIIIIKIFILIKINNNKFNNIDNDIED